MLPIAHRVSFAVRRALMLGCLVAIATPALIAAPLATPAWAASGAAMAQPEPAGAALERLEIETKNGPRVFSVEVMRTDAEREKGLMFRRFLPPDRGMLFDFKSDQPVMMWMRNTYIPLDMLFIRKDGTISHIAQDAEPLSDRIIPSDGPVHAVLELNAGTAKRLGIAVGDKVRNQMFTR